MTAPTTVCIIDAGIGAQRGHPVDYARSVCTGLRPHGIECRVFGGTSLAPGLAAELNATPIFEEKYDRLYVSRGGIASRLVDALLANYRYYRCVVRALRPLATPQWVVFAPTIGPRTVLAWAAIMARFAPARAPVFVLTVRFDPKGVGALHENVWRRRARRLFSRVSFVLLERAARKRRLALTTDSAYFIEEFKEVTRLPMAVLPIPHTTAEPLPHDGHSDCCFVFLGEARDEKGAHVVVNAVLRLADQARLDGLRFRLQSNVTERDSPRSMAALQRLRARNLTNVELLDGPLSRDDYVGILQSADAALLTYSQVTYRSRTSGPFAEAVAAGRGVIVTEGTWMAEQLSAGNGAGYSVRDGDADDLAARMLDFAAQRDTLRAQAMTASERWRTQHSPGGFASAFLAVVAAA